MRLKTQCTICPHNCKLYQNQHGKCLTRANINNTIVPKNYLQSITISIEPIEKKPFRHFKQNTTVISIGPNGCNLKCSFCINHQISQSIYPTIPITPIQILHKTLSNNASGVAYTFTEPSIWLESILEIAPMINQNNLSNLMISNGFFNKITLQQLLPHIDAFNISLKSINNSFYKKYCKASVYPILDNIYDIYKSNKHIELSHVIIPNILDNIKHLTSLSKWISYNLSPNIPLHILKFIPTYKFQAPYLHYGNLTKEQILEATSKYLNIVYI
jgi:pyruvate formate lyase activating enzyme